MKFVTLDFETYYDADYSLKKLTTEEYINDPRFQIIGVSAKIDNGPTVWKTGDMGFLKQQLGKPEWWAEVGLICHNTRFDGAILAWKFGIKPKMYFDTMSMARPKHSANVGVSLHALAEYYGLGRKGDEVVAALGKRLEDFSTEDLAAYGGYCRNDVDLTWALFNRLVIGYPKSELRLINRTLRMYIEPQLMLDPEMIQAEIDNEAERKAQLLAKVGELDASGFKSNDKFADILRSLGVDPPMKLSSKKSAKAGHDVFTYAFAKGDADFVALLEHENPLVAAAVEVRIGTKSTQKETRAARLAGIHQRCGGYLPVALDYYGAHTGRYAASEKINLQNLPRVKGKDPKSGLLRKAIIAPPGRSVVVADLSQIEARLLVWMAGQKDKVEAFAQKRDVYSEQASVIYGRPVDRKKNPDDFTPGFIGKAVVLGCGYGLGAPKFCAMIFVGMLGEKGILFDAGYVTAIGVDVTGFIDELRRRPDRAENYMSKKPAALLDEDWLVHCAVGTKIITMFRRSNPMIVAFWDTCNNVIAAMHQRIAGVEFGGPDEKLFRTVVDGDVPGILMPNGMIQRYEGLRREENGDYTFLRRKEGKVQRVKIYGGALAENLTQGLARIVVTDAGLRAEKLGYPMGLQVHDEIITTSAVGEEEVAYQTLLQCMREPPPWGRDIPLDAEGGYGLRYGDAK